MAGRTTVIDGVPPGNAHHVLDAEPQAIQVARDDGLNGLTTFVIVGRGDGDFAEMDRQVHFAQALHCLPDTFR